MNQIEKNEILKKVGSVLQFCQDIVTRLSNLDCSSSSPPPEVNNNYNNHDKEAATIAVEASVAEHYNDPSRELANTDKEAHKEFIETIAKFRDEKQKHYDIMDCDNDLWWDSSYPPLQFYTLMYDDDLASLYNSNMSEPEDLLIQSPTS